MAKEREKEYKPLSFSTTMRNPARIADFLNCILPFEGQILTEQIIHEVAVNLISKKLYKPTFIGTDPRLKAIYNSEDDFTVEDTEYIIKNSPQQHKEAGFEAGWPSRFDTWYKLPMEFGFIFYAMEAPIEISTTGHMLIDAVREVPKNDDKIQNVFLNAMMKYQTNNPFRKNSNTNAPLPLLLNVIKKLKDDPEEGDSGVFISELSMIICWPDNDADALYKEIKTFRKKHRFTYGDEVMYDRCLQILNADSSKKNRFKISQITGEAVDEFIRKMRITGLISLRGNGRFVDFNSFEAERIDYVIRNYTVFDSFSSKKDYFKYMGNIDPHILSIQHQEPTGMAAVKEKTINEWAEKHDKDFIYNELNITCSRNESHDPTLRIIDKPTRFEFLISIALKQHFKDLIIRPNYKSDDEGIPTFTAAGGMADIECFDKDCNPLVEVTLMQARTQATNEMPAITRHLTEAIEKYPDTKVFTLFIAPALHADTIYMAKFSKFQYNVDIVTLNIKEFIEKLKEVAKIIDFVSVGE